MSYRVGTPNYNLPQTEGTDKRDWFDTNEAFRNIDADLHAVVEQSSSQSAVIEALQTDVGNLQTGLEDTNTEVDGIKTKQATDEENIAQNAQAISQLNTKVESLDTDLAEMIEVTEEPSATATVQHNVGTYFRYNDNLWITTVLIRVGDEIVPNVNCETTDVMSRVYQLEHSGGGSVSADAVSFDNTGTDLVSTNVENVVKELNNKIPTIPTLIDDTTTASNKTWSSQKINEELEPKTGDVRYYNNKLQRYNGTIWVDVSVGGIRKVGDSAANQTYAVQLAELKTLYDTLTDTEKANSYIMDGNVNRFAINRVDLGTYCMSFVGATSGSITSFHLSSAQNIAQVTNAGGTTFTDNSSNTNTNAMTLYVNG